MSMCHNTILIFEVNCIEQCNRHGLIRRKARVQIPAQTSKRKYENLSSATSSQQISGKNSESKKI